MEVWGPMLAIMTPIISAIIGAFTYMWKQISELQTQHKECVVRTALLEAQIAILNFEMERKSKESDAIIVVGEHAIIKEWSPGATLLFHWPQREALGKSITALMPERLRDPFQTAFAIILASKRPPRRGPHHAFGRTKDGEEIPITMWYSGWEDENGARMFGATIRLRSASEVSEELFSASVSP